MTVRVLSGDDVRASLTMKDCIEAMDAVLRQFAAGDLYLPLRAVVRPPKSPGLMGLMTAHRAGDAPAFGLKAVAIFPENPARGLDAHQGVVVVFDGVTGQVSGLVDASSITAIRTAAVSAVATRALARAGASSLAVLGAGVQAAAHIEAMASVLPLERVRIYSRRPEPAAELAAATAARYAWDVSAAASVEDALRDADVVVTTTTAREPIVERAWLAPGRTSTPSARASRRRASSTEQRWPPRASSSTPASPHTASRATSCSPCARARSPRTSRWPSSARCWPEARRAARARKS